MNREKKTREIIQLALAHQSKYLLNSSCFLFRFFFFLSRILQFAIWKGTLTNCVNKSIWNENYKQPCGHFTSNILIECEILSLDEWIHRNICMIKSKSIQNWNQRKTKSRKNDIAVASVYETSRDTWGCKWTHEGYWRDLWVVSQSITINLIVSAVALQIGSLNQKKKKRKQQHFQLDHYAIHLTTLETRRMNRFHSLFSFGFWLNRFFIAFCMSKTSNKKKAKQSKRFLFRSV